MTAWLLAAAVLGCSDDAPEDAAAAEAGPGTVSVDAAARGDAATGTPIPTERCENDDPALSLGPLLGAVSDHSVKVWAQADQAARLSVAIRPTDRPADVRHVGSAPLEEAGAFIGVVTIGGLEPATDYTYEVLIDDRLCSGQYAFRTLPPAGTPGRVRFVTAGDVNGPDIPGFTSIAAVEPAFVLMVGDNVYADGFGQRIDAYRERYEGVYSGEQFQGLFAKTPSFMIWDDHELVDNYWEGKNDAVYAFARTLYEQYQHSRNPEPLAPGELYYSFEVGDVGIFVLDTRSHRAPNTDPDDAAKTMLGSAQKERLEAWLSENAYRVHIIVSSVLMSDFSTTGLDSWQAFTTEREEILASIVLHRPSNLIVVSGDQHWSAILRLDRGDVEPYSIYEFQATPLGFDERGAPQTTDDRVIALDNTHQVFAVFDIVTSADPVQIDYTLCAVGRPCAPHEEPPPVTEGSVTSVPYTVHFQGNEGRGVEMLPPAP